VIDFSAYLAAQRLTQELVSEALPDAPVRVDRVPVARRARVIAARQWLSLTLRRLADRLEPLPEPAKPAMAGCR
jgi:hypothetical protein